MEITAAELASFIGGVVEGNSSAKISNYAKIEEAKAGDLTFIANPKYNHYIHTTGASVVLVSTDFSETVPDSVTVIRVKDPYEVLAKLLNMVSASKPTPKGIESPAYIASGVEIDAETCYVGAFAYISEGVSVGKNTRIYPQAFLGKNVKIGNNVIIYAGVKIYDDCVIGNNCIIHAGAVIGADGFGFAPHNGEYEKIAQIGNVVIEDNVEIGANTTIDRATMGSTYIRKGVKLDNLIQVAHNVEIGEHTVMAAQVGVAGSTKIGHHNMVGGQVGFAGHIKIGDYNEFGAQSGIPNNVGSNKRMIGYPAVNFGDFARQTVYVKRLASLFSDVADIKKKLK